MNRMMKEKSMLRKKGNVYVLDLFVRVPSSVAVPVTYTPLEVDAINQVAAGRESRRRVTLLQQPNFLTAGEVSVEDLSQRAETVRPQLDERCEKRRECDSVLSATDDENGDELNAETDDEDPGQPTAKEHQEHMTTHRPCRSQCKFCVMGRGVNAPHRRSDAEDDLEGVPLVSMDFGFLGERRNPRIEWVLCWSFVNGGTR